MKHNFGLITAITLTVLIPLWGRGSIAQADIIETPSNTSEVKATALPISHGDGGLTIFQDAIKARDERIAREAAEKQRAAEAALAAAATANESQAAPPVYQSPCSDPKSCIYMKESGNNPLARNAGGCLGLGQACPGSKLLAVCPNLDYACEDAFFTSYAINRYGSWANAWSYWQGHGYW